eukprot:6190154-Pleurochrysis_carterae.AAC.2
MTSNAEGLARGPSRALDRGIGRVTCLSRAGSRAVCGRTAPLFPVDDKARGVATRFVELAAASLLVPCAKGATLAERCSGADVFAGLPIDAARDESFRVLEWFALKLTVPSSSRRDALLVGAATKDALLGGGARTDALLGEVARRNALLGEVVRRDALVGGAATIDTLLGGGAPVAVHRFDLLTPGTPCGPAWSS